MRRRLRLAWPLAVRRTRPGPGHGAHPCDCRACACAGTARDAAETCFACLTGHHGEPRVEHPLARRAREFLGLPADTSAKIVVSDDGDGVLVLPRWPNGVALPVAAR